MDTTTVTPSTVTFYKRYSDNSGNEPRITADLACNDEGVSEPSAGMVELEVRGVTCEFPLMDLQWFIDRLQTIQLLVEESGESVRLDLARQCSGGEMT